MEKNLTSAAPTDYHRRWCHCEETLHEVKDCLGRYNTTMGSIHDVAVAKTAVQIACGDWFDVERTERDANRSVSGHLDTSSG